MPVSFDEKKKIFRLDTGKSTYLMGLSPEGFLGHIYYGDRLVLDADNYLLRMEEPPYTPSVNKREKSAFLDFFPMEYPTGGIGDYRESCLNIRNAAGNMGCELHYAGHEIFKGKKGLAGLPASFATEDEAETLEITMKDEILNLEVVLSYTAFPEENVITRSVKVQNRSQENLRIEKILSVCLDMDNENFSMLSLHGTWARERHIQTGELHYGKQVISSARGESSHQEHPFMALVTNGTDQENGKVYAMHFVYSGNFLAETELCQFDNLRMTMGISPEEFSWLLEPGETFQAPEVVMTYSGNGLGQMTRSYHDFYRNHLIRSKFKYEKRPILINNWEATYFDFNTDKLLAIARQAKECGIEMLVMDDGWFGKRNSDNCSLGDWKVNEEKITGGLKYLVDEVNKIGLQFGIWFEPEMISPDSDLYRTHPDWAIQIAGREATQSRTQYVLDLSRPEVRDYAYECVASVLRSANIAYVKWDMNRQLSDLGSSYLPKERQQELFHRYVLGVYELQERLVTEFPDLLLENCSGGGARFDPGMLCYSPQIWCSDDTDAVERLMIQEGSALVYPLSVIGAHVSDCPNHSVGRVTPFETRGHVALAGTFGYELDITKIPEEDRRLIPEQTATYKKYRHLIQQGEYYRIASYRENHKFDCWALSSRDKKEVLVTYVQVLGVPNSHSRKIFLKGFDPETVYKLEGTDETYTGEMLMKGGFLMKDFRGDFKSRLYHFIAE